MSKQLPTGDIANELAGSSVFFAKADEEASPASPPVVEIVEATTAPVVPTPAAVTPRGKESVWSSADLSSAVDDAKARRAGFIVYIQIRTRMDTRVSSLGT